MGIEKSQNSETKEVNQSTPSFEELRQKVIELNNKVYKSNNYELWMRFWMNLPYVSFKKQKRDIRWKNVKKHNNFFGPNLWVWVTKMSKKERERFESDKQEMNQLISDLEDLYWLNLPEGNIYVNEENGKVVINYYDLAKWDAALIDIPGAASDDNEDVKTVEIKSKIQIICDWEKAVLKRDGKEEKELKQRTPEEIKNYKNFNYIYNLLNEDIKYTDSNGVDHSISVGDRSIIIQDWQTEYLLMKQDNWDFASSEVTNGDEEIFINPLSPEDVAKSLQNIQEKINEWKIINSQKATEKFDEAQKNEWDLAEEELDKALENI